MAKEVKFGVPTIVKVEECANKGGWSWVRIEQSVTSEYTGDGSTNNRFAFMAEVAPLGPLTYESVRKNSQLVTNAVAASVKVGTKLNGKHIQYVKYSTPQWDGQQPAEDGLYYVSHLTNGFVEDRNGDADAAKTKTAAPFAVAEA